MSISRSELKDLRGLKSKKTRARQKRFSAEGVRLLEEACRFSFWPVRVYVATGELSRRGQELVERFQKREVPVADISARDLEAVSDTETPQGILAVFQRPTQVLAELYRPQFRRVLWCDRVADPGNLGTLIRSALAFDFDLVVVGDGTAEVYAPKVVRSSMGAVFGIGVARAGNEEILETVKREDLRLVAATADGDVELRSRRDELAAGGVMLAIGAEADGLAPEICDQASVSVRVRHSERVESLNAAVAGSILMEQLYV